MTPIEVARAEVRTGVARCHRQASAVPGTYRVEVTCSTMPMPLSLLYYRWIEPDTLEYLWIWSHPGIRGCGICEFIADWCQQFHLGELRRIVTAAATRDSRAYLEEAGFQHGLHGWYLDLVPRDQDDHSPDAEAWAAGFQDARQTFPDESSLRTMRCNAADLPRHTRLDRQGQCNIPLAGDR